MSPQQIVSIIVRLFAIGLAVHSFQTAYFSLEDPGGAYMKLSLVYFGLALIIAALLWRFPSLVSRKIMGADLDKKAEDNWNYDKLYSIGFVLVGILWLVRALSDLVYWLGFSIYITQMPNGSLQLDADQKAAVVSTVFEAVIALTLIFGTKGWLKLVSLLRFGRSSDS